jgi:AraC-like DNA-binding protein
MFTADDLFKLGDTDSNQTWNGQIACMLIHKENLLIEQPMDGASVFSFALVKQGHFTINYDGTEMIVHPGEMNTYAPGLPLTMLHVTDDYEGYCVLIDEKLVRDTPMIDYLIRAAYKPIAEFSKPLFQLDKKQASLMWDDLTMLRRHIMQKSDFQRETILALCQVFCIDLINAQNLMVESSQISSRYERIFSQFLQLVPKHFLTHHDLKFYADCLNISTPYLSRIVRVMSGRTVMYFIDHALATEAARRLKGTEQSVTEMAFDFGFSDQAAFTKFFIRMKGKSPKNYRKLILL